MCERSGSDDYELCINDDAIQQIGCTWPSLSRTLSYHQSPELLSYACSRLPHHNNQTTFQQGPSNRSEFASQNVFTQTTMSTKSGGMSWSQHESQTMTPYDWNYGSLNFPDTSAIGSNSWLSTGPTDGVDDNHTSLQGMGNEIHLESFSQVPAANSPRAMLNMVSSPSCQRSRPVPMLFRSETCHVHRRLLRLPVSGMDK